MDRKMMYRIFGFLSFLVAFLTYALTVQPSVPFWDCGEFSGASVWQQVPHPPGAPLFLMFGKLFQIIIPFGDIGWRINMLSVVASAISILLLYLITVKVIMNFKNSNEMSTADYIAVYGSAFVGALAFTFTDTFWFNAVESEVYAASQLFVSLILYLMMRWNEQADTEGHEKYLLLIAYLIGLSTGVHLLALLTIFSIVLVVYFRKYSINVKSFIYMGVFAVVIFFVIYPGIVKWLPALLAGNLPFKNELRQYTSSGMFYEIFAIGAILGVMYLFYYGHKHHKPIMKLTTLTFLFMLFGYTTYTQILIRSHANPPMNENEPKTFESLTSYLGREQYGAQWTWPRRTDYNDETKMMLYNSKDENGEYIYGEWNPPSTKAVTGADGKTYGAPDWDNVNVSGDLNYMFKYQINKMFIRYFMWNFVGKASDVQDSPSAFIDKSDAQTLNYNSPYAGEYPARYFALPLLFGLFGLFFHFWKDPKMAFAWLTAFLLMGVLAALQQNQQDPQPRERDYFYTGAFYVFSLWIGLGTYGIIEYLAKKKLSTALAAGVVAVSLLIVPINMAFANWKTHSRAGNYLAFDYSYNLLQSVEKDAILFTNGDNDTFPVWWLQDVAGVRRDVRIVNLSLGQTQWYIKQLKHREPWGAKKVPITIPDSQLDAPEYSEDALQGDGGPAQHIVIPVTPEIIKQYTDDQSYINAGKMEFDYVGKPYGNPQPGQPQIYSYTIYNKLVKDIVVNNKFERPVYFSTTAGRDVYIGLDRYLRAEGMAYKICPVPRELMKEGYSNSKVNDLCLLTSVDNTDNYSLTPKYGFKFRNLNNMKVYYDEVHRGYAGSYRMLFLNYALYTLDVKKDNAKAVQILNAMNSNISLEQFPLQFDEQLQLALLYEKAQDMNMAKKMAEMAIKSAQEVNKNPKLRSVGRRSRIPSENEEVLGVGSSTYKTIADANRLLGKYDEALSTIKELGDKIKQGYNNPNLMQYKQYLEQNYMDVIRMMYHIYDTKINSLVAQGKKAEAQKFAAETAAKFKASQDPMEQQLGEMFERRSKDVENPLKATDTADNDTNTAAGKEKDTSKKK